VVNASRAPGSRAIAVSQRGLIFQGSQTLPPNPGTKICWIRSAVMAAAAVAQDNLHNAHVLGTSPIHQRGCGRFRWRRQEGLGNRDLRRLTNPLRDFDGITAVHAQDAKARVFPHTRGPW
jgi:hypothetical protein